MILTSEFAAVEVEVEAGHSPQGPRLKITDLGTGQTASLDASAALSAADRRVATGHVGYDLTIELDQAANGPRLKITDPRLGRTVYLDPLELADAAATGVWGQFPAAYGERLSPPG